MEKPLAPASLRPLFVSEVYRTDLAGTSLDGLLDDLNAACRRIATADKAGQEWSKYNAYKGYTSYYTVPDLAGQDAAFVDLKHLLEAQARVFGTLLEFDLQGRTPRLGNWWINMLEPGGAHSGHIHPRSAYSGTIYIDIPDGAGDLHFEDPRAPLMMHSPGRKAEAQSYRKGFVTVTPKRGTLLMWESWLRHQVGVNLGAQVRISISFNFDLQ